MKTIFILLISTVIAAGLYAQNFQAVPINGVTIGASTDGMCDTLNGAEASSWPAYYYTYTGGGTIFGVGNLRDISKKVIETANFFDISGSDYKYITGGLVYFAFANTNTPANLNKTVLFKLYDDAAGKPGAVVDSAVLTLAQIRDDVAAGRLTEFKFNTPVAINAAQKFYISVNTNKFRWAPNVKDSIAIAATADDQLAANTAFHFLNEGRGLRTWYAVDDFWKSGNIALDVSLFIFPYVSEDAAGCQVVLPVSMFNFGGVIKDSKAYLNWSTAAESNNTGFYVERSNDGRDFASVGFVKGAGNTSSITNYSFVDVSLKDINVTTTYYRLKQVDVDGKFTYSKVLALNLETVDAAKWKIFPNPVKDVATIQVRLSAASKVSAQVISQDGKVLATVDKGIMPEGLQQFYINTQNIAKGTYVIRIKADDKIYSGLIVKQ